MSLLLTDAELSSHLLTLELDLLSPAVRRDPSALRARLASDFREFGSSGREFSLQSILDDLANEAAAELALTDFQCTRLAPDAALVTYRSSRTTRNAAEANGTSFTRHALRSSIWVLRKSRWQCLFHQGTRIDV